MRNEIKPGMREHAAASAVKQVGVAVCLECWLFHLGVAGSSPGHDNLGKPLGEYAALLRLCMIDGTKTGKSL